MGSWSSGGRGTYETFKSIGTYFMATYEYILRVLWVGRGFVICVQSKLGCGFDLVDDQKFAQQCTDVKDVLVQFGYTDRECHNPAIAPLLQQPPDAGSGGLCRLPAGPRMKQAPACPRRQILFIDVLPRDRPLSSHLTPRIRQPRVRRADAPRRG